MLKEGVESWYCTCALANQSRILSIQCMCANNVRIPDGLFRQRNDRNGRNGIERQVLILRGPTPFYAFPVRLQSGATETRALGVVR